MRSYEYPSLTRDKSSKQQNKQMEEVMKNIRGVFLAGHALAHVILTGIYVFQPFPSCPVTLAMCVALAPSLPRSLAPSVPLLMDLD